MLSQELQEKLEKIAYAKSVAFCYHCYKDAPTGRCETCGSDDLMRRTSGGVEYGVDHVIKELIEENLTPIDVEAEYEEFMSSCYTETVNICGIDFDAVHALKELDPVCWNIGQSDWLDAEESDENIVSFDNGGTYYRTSDVEDFVDEYEEET